MTSVLMSMTVGSAKLYDIHVNASVSVKVFGEISVHVMVEKWQNLKDTLVFLSFLCVRIEIESCQQVICCPIGQSSVNISLALRTRDIHTSPLTSNRQPITK